jgi:potassium efflux system protein
MKTLKRCFKWFSLILILIALSLTPLLAQTSQTEDTKQQESQDEVTAIPQEKPALEPISSSEITLRSEETNTKLNTTRSVLSPDPGIAKINSEVLVFIDVIKKSKKNLPFIEIKDLSLNQLDDLRDEWQLHRMKVSVWHESVAARSSILETEGVKLDKLLELWELTRVSAVEEQYPNALNERITSVLGEIEEVDKSLRERLEEIFSLQGKISNQSLEINNVLSEINTALIHSHRRLFTQDSLPLWKTLIAPKEETSLSKQIKEIWQKKSDILVRYLNDNWEKLLITILVFIVLSAILFKLLQRSQKWRDEDEELHALIEIFKLPLSIALLITLLTANWIFPQPPQIFLELIGILFLIPLIRLVPGLVTPKLRSFLYGLGGLYLLHSIYEQMPERSTIQRLLIIVTVSLAVGGLAWMLKKGGALQSIQGERQKSVAMIFPKIAFILLTIAWFANIFGYFYLSGLFVDGTLTSIYVLVILLVSVVVLEGLLAAFLRSDTAQSLRIFRLHIKLWKRKTITFLRFAAVVLWIYYVLESFAVLDSVLNFLTKAIESPLKVGSLSIALGDVIAFLLTLWLSILLSRFIRFVLNEDVLPRLTLPRGVPGAISFIAYNFILIVGLLFALSAAGIELSRFALLAGALGIGIGFGLQNLVNNFVSGLILVFERPIKVGDTIEFGSQRGQVLRIGIRSSTIRNWEGAGIEIPFPQRDLHVRSIDTEAQKELDYKKNKSKKDNS